MSSIAETRVVLFDFDGTVADTHEIIYRCLDETASELLGVGFPRPLWREHIGTPLADLFSLLSPKPSASVIETLIGHYRARQLDLEHSIRPFPGIEAMLETLRGRGIRMAIVTTKMRGVASRHLQAIGLADYFEAVVGFDDCRKVKPDAEPFLVAMRKLGVAASSAMGVGDSPVDVHGARAAGIASVAALWGTVSRDALLAANPDHVVPEPMGLPRVVGIRGRGASGS